MLEFTLADQVADLPPVMSNTPLTPPDTPEKSPKHPPNENKGFQLWQLIFAKFNM